MPQITHGLGRWRRARVASSLGVVAALLATLAAVSPATAQDDDTGAAVPAPSVDWQQTGLTGRATGNLFTPASGALFVQAAPPGGALHGYQTPLMRSDDAGKTWRPAITNRTDLTGISVDPASQFTVYAEGPRPPTATPPTRTPPQLIFKSTDDSQTFSPVYPIASTDQVLDLEPSPADSNVLYMLMKGSATSFLESSQDGGATWKSVFTIDPQASPNCRVVTSLLHPHPTNAQHLFFGGGCYAVNDTGGQPLLQSMDGGATFTSILQGSGQAPSGVVGGAGANPTRLYAAMEATRPGAPSDVYRSDDDGATWNSVYELQGPDARTSSPNHVTAMTYNSTNPDQVYLAVSGPGGGVQATQDGGEAWSYVGNPATSIGTVTDLAVGIDGKNLYAATDEGLWVYPLSAPAVAQVVTPPPSLPSPPPSATPTPTLPPSVSASATPVCIFVYGMAPRASDALAAVLAEVQPCPSSCGPARYQDPNVLDLLTPSPTPPATPVPTPIVCVPTYS